MGGLGLFYKQIKRSMVTLQKSGRVSVVIVVVVIVALVRPSQLLKSLTLVEQEPAHPKKTSERKQTRKHLYPLVDI